MFSFLSMPAVLAAMMYGEKMYIFCSIYSQFAYLAPVLSFSETLI